MARKRKKSKKGASKKKSASKSSAKKKKAGGGAATEEVIGPPESGADEPEPSKKKSKKKKASSKRSSEEKSSKKESSGREKTSSKKAKAASKTEAPEEAPVLAPDESDTATAVDVDENLDEGLDELESAAALAALVAEVAAPGDAIEPLLSEAAEEDSAETDVTVLDLDADEEEVTVVELDEEDDVEVTQLDEENDIEVVDLDADLDEQLERDRLIAETLAIADETEAADEAESAEATDVSEPGDAAYEAADVGDGDAADEAELTDDDPDLLMTRQAVAALAEIHEEGMASLPEELILDLGEAASEEERDRLLRAALAHSEMQEAIYRVPTVADGTTGRIKGTVAAVLFVAAIVVWARPPEFVTPAPPAQLQASDLEHGVRVSLLIQAQQVEAFRAREERLPDSLDEVPLRVPGVRFVRSSNRLYQLIAYLPSGEAVVYDTAAPSFDFDSLDYAWARTQEPS